MTDDRCVHGRHLIDPCIGCGRRYRAGELITVCPTCEGCGQIANTPEGEPWSVWMNLPLKSALAVTLGFVHPVMCPDCGGAEAA